MSIKLFNNVLVYSRSAACPQWTLPELSQALETCKASPLKTQEISTLGFIEPVGEEGAYVEALPDSRYLLSMLKTEKIIPGKVIKEEVQARITAIEQRDGRKVYAKERGQLKDDVVMALLPRAFPTSSRVNVLLTPTHVYVDQSSVKKAEDVLSLLRKVLGTFPVGPVMSKLRPAKEMTEWVLSGTVGDGPCMLGESFQSRAISAESSTLSGKRLDLSDSDLHEMLSAGREITQLEVILPLDGEHSSTTIPFTLTENMGLKGIKWPLELDDDIDAATGEDRDPVTELRVSMILVSDMLDVIRGVVTDALGGENLGVAFGKPDEEDIL